MRLSTVPLTLAQFLLPPAIIGTIYLYLYPAIQQCSFPPAKRAEAACYFDGSNQPAVSAEIAPFRLLAFGDPQLEGDTSLPAGLGDGLFPSFREGFWTGVEQGNTGRFWEGVRPAILGLITRDVPRLLHYSRKRVDLWGNDLYLAHIYWLMGWWTQPSHTVVLGDLLGSQWIGDEEFKRRSGRFWGKVFKSAEKVPGKVTDVSGRIEVLGHDEKWKKRLITVVGNHDIGYAGDIDERRIERFEDAFGSMNWEVRFRLNDSSSTPSKHSPSLSTPSFDTSPPELRLIVLNSMNLDSPVLKPALQQQSLDFLDEQLRTPVSASAATILLTHIPLHKEAGICVDAPYFTYFPTNQGGGIREQNHLSLEMSERILGGLLPAGGAQQAIVLNGHDHEGCDTFHYRSDPPQTASSASEGTEPAHDQPSWQATPYQLSHPHRSNSSLTSLREITVRAMMGSYGGNAGLLSAWFDPEERRWGFEYSTCMLGVQHIWWAVHILDLVVLGMAVGGFGLAIWEEIGMARREEGQGMKTVKLKRG